MSFDDVPGRARREIVDSFDARAAGYANNQWHRRCAERLVGLCRLGQGLRVLDAATGTGFAALAASTVVGPEGHVVGVDLSPGMLREARAAVAQAQRTNVELVEGDVVDLPQYSSGSFDVVTCAAGLLYLPVAEALREWHRLLVPDGIVAFSSMRAGSPRAGQLFRNCAAAYGVTLQDPSEPVGSVDACTQVLEDAGFEPIRIATETIEFTPADLRFAWESNLGSAGHGAVRQLGAAELASFERQYRETIEREARDNPHLLGQAGILYAIGRR